MSIKISELLLWRSLCGSAVIWMMKCARNVSFVQQTFTWQHPCCIYTTTTVNCFFASILFFTRTDWVSRRRALNRWRPGYKLECVPVLRQRMFIQAEIRKDSVWVPLAGGVWRSKQDNFTFWVQMWSRSWHLLSASENESHGVFLHLPVWEKMAVIFVS